MMTDNMFLWLCLHDIMRQRKWARDMYSFVKKEDDYMKRVIWDKKEAALLVDIYQKIEAKPSQKNELLHRLSNVLWKRAVSKGLEIDERFRNFNGMKFQYELLCYLMTDGEQGLSGNMAKTIAEMAEIYRSETEKFNEIIKRIIWVSNFLNNIKNNFTTERGG